MIAILNIYIILTTWSLIVFLFTKVERTFNILLF